MVQNGEGWLTDCALGEFGSQLVMEVPHTYDKRLAEEGQWNYEYAGSRKSRYQSLGCDD